VPVTVPGTVRLSVGVNGKLLLLGPPASWRSCGQSDKLPAWNRKEASTYNDPPGALPGEKKQGQETPELLIHIDWGNEGNLDTNKEQ
jgi:hypothetical protein